MPFRCWVGIWTAFFVFLIVAFDLSALVRYITRFTEESFASLIALIFIFEAFKKEISIIKMYPITVGEPDNKCYECFCTDPIVANGTMMNSTSDTTTSIPVVMTAIAGSGYTFVDDMASNMSHMLNYSMMTIDECKKHNGTLVGDGCDIHKSFPDVFFLSILLFLGTFVIASTMSNMKSGRFFPSAVSKINSFYLILM